mgnify:CR=1 FL=1
MLPPEKFCRKCNTIQPLANWNKHKSRSTGLQAYCKNCEKKYKKKYASENREKFRELKRRWKYGLQFGSYDKMLESQDYRCAICMEVKQLVIDHDHKTGIVRGLLCVSCNSALGKFKDSPLILASAISYLGTV